MDLKTRNMLSILFIKNSSSRLCLVKCYVKLVCFRCFSTKHWEDQTRAGQRVIYSYVHWGTYISNGEDDLSKQALYNYCPAC